MASNIFWDDVQHNGSQWVAVGNDAGWGALENINYSSNGSAWSAATGGSYIDKRMPRVRWNGTLWAALTTDSTTPGHGMTSTNGSSWTNRDVPNLSSGVAEFLSVFGSTFSAAGGGNTNAFFTSTDGFNFSASGGTLPYTTAWGACASNAPIGASANGYTTVILTSGNNADDNRAAYSINGSATWSATNVLPYTTSWSNLIWTGRCFLAFDFNLYANVARSYDGITTWTAVTMPAPAGILNWGNPCVNAKGTIFIPMWYKSGFGAHTILYASVDDGDNWCLNTLSQNGQWGCAGSDGTRVVVCGNNISGAPNTQGSYADPS